MDNSKVLVRLQLIGAAVFNREAKHANEGLKGIGKGGRVAGKGLQETSRSGDRATSALSRFQRGTLFAKRGLGGIETAAASTAGALTHVGVVAGALAAAGLASGIKQSVDFEQSMANVQARLLTTGASMDKLRGLALELGAKTQFSAGQAADAMNELAAQGFSVKQIMGVLPGTLSLAAASGTDLANAAMIQTETLHGFGLSARQAGRVADVLAQTANRSAAGIDDMQESIKYIAPVAKASGQSLEDMMSAVGLLSNVGIKGSQAGTTLRTAMVRLSNPTDKARGALADLGLKAGDLAGKKGLLSLPNILGKVVRGAQGVSKNTRNAALASIFGREALSGMVALVEAGPKKFDRMSRALEHSTGAAKRAASIMRNTVKGAWDNFTGSIETAAIALLHRFQPAMKNALNQAAGFVNQIGPHLHMIGQAFSTGRQGGRSSVQGYSGAAGVAGRAGAAVGRSNPLTALRTGASTGSKSAVSGFSGLAGLAGKAGVILRKVGDGAVKVGRQLLDAFKPAAPFLKNVLLPLLQGVAMGVIGGVVTAFKIAVPVIKLLATALGAVGKIAAPFRGVIKAIGVVIGFVFGGEILDALAVIGRLGAAMGKIGIPLRLLGGLFRLAAIPIRLVAGAARSLGGIFRVAGAVMRRFANGLQFVNRWLAFSRSSFGRALGAVTNFVSGVIGRLARLPGQAIAKIRAMAGGIVKFLRGGGFLGMLFRAARPIGAKIVDGIAGAIKAAPGAIASALLSVIPGPVKGAVKKVLGLVPGIASGGTVRSSGWAVVGERGPELARFPGGTTVFDHRQSARALAAQRQAPTMLKPAPIHVHVQPNDLVVGNERIHAAAYKHERFLVERS